ncbi:8283_t:CDS:2, partial [Entrophospora sp. SA101]
MTQYINPKGVDASIIKNDLHDMILLAKSYNLEKANWKEISDLIKFDEPELIQSLVVHSYDIDIYEKYGFLSRLPEVKNYLSDNMLFIPADYPGQLYLRRAVIKRLNSIDNTSIPKEILHILSFLGPLHLSLNTCESVFLTFWGFFDSMYRTVFGKKKKLTAKPKPWIVNLLLYLAHGGWQIVK